MSNVPEWADELETFANRIAVTTGRRLTQVRIYTTVARTYYLMTSTGIVKVVEEPNLEGVK
jgi:hypothetical protein